MRIDFYMGPEFLRTEQNTNPFFDPIIKVCEENGIEWRALFPAKPKACGYPADKIASFGFWQRGSVWFWRIVHLFWHVPTWRINFLYGKILGWFGILKSEFAITVAGWATIEVAGANPTARIVDVQHGVIYSHHRGYFDNQKRLSLQSQVLKNREFWLYGKGYADCFFKNPDNAKDLEGRVKVIGDVVRANQEKCGTSGHNRGGERNLVVFSLQLTADLSPDEMVRSVEKMEAFFTDFFTRFGDKYKCYVKHHPRYNKVYDLSSFYKNFPQVTETKEQWTTLYDKMALHVTFTSTVTFDCASQGIPTYLVELPHADILNRDYYRDDYHYPYFDKTAEEILSMPLDEVKQSVINWYKEFYELFDEAKCLKILQGKV